METKDVIGVIGAITALIGVVPPVVGMFKSNPASLPPVSCSTGAACNFGSGTINQNTIIAKYVDYWNAGFSSLMNKSNPAQDYQATKASSIGQISSIPPSMSNEQAPPGDLTIRHSNSAELHEQSAPTLAGPAEISSTPIHARDQLYRNLVLMDNWMQQWMSRKKVGDGDLIVGRFADHYYYLTKVVQWKPSEPESHLPVVRVPQGFVMDFSSIPGFAWSLVPPDEYYIYPAVVHDYLYWSQETTRKNADEILHLMMEELSVPKSVIATIDTAVRVGGAIAWADNAHLKQLGERRVLAVLPSDPETRWTIWRTRDVFARSFNQQATTPQVLGKPDVP